MMKVMQGPAAEWLVRKLQALTTLWPVQHSVIHGSQKTSFVTTLTPGTRKKYCETGQCSTAEVNTSATHKNNLFSKLTYKFLTARLYQYDPQTKFSFLCEMQWNWKQ